jgi:DNA repair protein RadC
MLGGEELLSLLLGGRDRDARRLWADLGSFSLIARCSPVELMRRTGVDAGAAVCVAAAFEVAGRAAGDLLRPGRSIRSSQDVFEAYGPRLRGSRKETFYVVLLDGKHRVMREELVSVGSLTASLVHPREVFGPAMRESAAAIILVHNHPSGDPTPSPEDIAVTARLVEVGRLVGISVVDHVVVGGGGFVSCLERGYLDG